MIDRNNPRFDFKGTHKSSRLEITEHILRCFELEIKEREVKIMNLASIDTDENGECMNIMHATKVTDLLAPLVTACDMLRHCGIYVDDPTLEFEDLPFLLNCLAGLNIFIIGHDHLTDDELWACLQAMINEEYPFLPPAEYVIEFWPFDEEISAIPDYKSLRTVPAPLNNITDAVIEQRNTRKDTK